MSVRNERLACGRASFRDCAWDDLELVEGMSGITRVSWIISYRIATVPGACTISYELPYWPGSIEPGSPRVMHRSHRLKSRWLLNGPLPKLPVRATAAMRARAAGSSGGI